MCSCRLLCRSEVCMRLGLCSVSPRLSLMGLLAYKYHSCFAGPPSHHLPRGSQPLMKLYHHHHHTALVHPTRFFPTPGIKNKKTRYRNENKRQCHERKGWKRKGIIQYRHAILTWILLTPGEFGGTSCRISESLANSPSLGLAVTLLSYSSSNIGKCVDVGYAAYALEATASALFFFFLSFLFLLLFRSSFLPLVFVGLCTV